MSGLRAFIAIHNTTHGPGLGGCRMWSYASEEEALTDALRLSQGMSYKHAVAGTPYGGAKAVILGNPREEKTEDLLRAFGRCVESLGGRYVTAEDVGMSVNDMVCIRDQTQYVAGLPTSMGGSGDPSPVTAYGVFCGLQAAVAFRHDRPYDPYAKLFGTTVAVQGLGNVGYALCQYLHKAGAQLIVTDINQPRVEQACREFSATATEAEAIYDTDADVFAPCALGGALSSETVPRLKASIVAGAANNQLAEPGIAAMLARREVLYAPDYVINAGGIINISCEGESYSLEQAMARTEQIGGTLTEIFHKSSDTGRSTADISDEIARR
ncbi:Glu/Leu/Phe/Val family dehydrogenase [Aeoliella mucimassa]|uniref:Leucine dehydrogenase n=1 Tax=Aeoliella mucimassa TaxID=2527972 RepID=A0A518APP3_9BACT|nr:Glu/Leu/Phe/Val dehydrogenase [Aeoliella mucimassa]QDU56700.1 Leucine dehydrogenase [Aeoliella mucimassa]